MGERVGKNKGEFSGQRQTNSDVEDISKLVHMIRGTVNGKLMHALYYIAIERYSIPHFQAVARSCQNPPTLEILHYVKSVIIHYPWERKYSQMPKGHSAPYPRV